MFGFLHFSENNLPLQITLEGKVALVTGAGRGIGMEIARTLAQAGARIVVNDLTNESCQRTAQMIGDLNSQSLIASGDVSSQSDVQSIFEKSIATFGKLDILVNNAGVIYRKPVVDMSEDEWDKTLDVNLKGNFLCSKAASQIMIKQGNGGKIINISSIMGEVALPPRSAYCASKGGIIALTRALATELAGHRITVNAVGPGWVETELTARYFADSDVKQLLISRTPLQRFCKPSEVAMLVAYLASTYSDFITGQTLFVDGGWTAL
jgi:2-dehydro-3-deoxy-D-gluconate 5-dehydrogenase